MDITQDITQRLMTASLYEHKEIITVRGIEHTAIANFLTNSLNIYCDDAAGLSESYSLNEYTNFEGNITDFIEAELQGFDNIVAMINKIPE